MRQTPVRLGLASGLAAALWCFATGGSAAELPAHERTQDVVYGRKHGMALTLDVFTPRQNANGRGVIWVVSGGWFSAHESVGPEFPFSPLEGLLGRGYTIFAVVHGSQPRFTVPEILEDMHRAVRYVRFHAAKYGVDPDKIGIVGASAGGHLSLMQGTAGREGDPQASDAIDRLSSRVQAVACFVPPTDFLNFGEPGVTILESEHPIIQQLRAPFAFQKLEREGGLFGAFVPITDEAEVRKTFAGTSPINHVTEDDPPALIIHGEKDPLVPLEQAQRIAARFGEAGVPARLVVKPGAGHSWTDTADDMTLIADWFDEHLRN